MTYGSVIPQINMRWLMDFYLSEFFFFFQFRLSLFLIGQVARYAIFRSDHASVQLVVYKTFFMRKIKASCHTTQKTYSVLWVVLFLCIQISYRFEAIYKVFLKQVIRKPLNLLRSLLSTYLSI